MVDALLVAVAVLAVVCLLLAVSLLRVKATIWRYEYRIAGHDQDMKRLQESHDRQVKQIDDRNKELEVAIAFVQRPFVINGDVVNG